jgi:uncharacterized protein YndB with AHSA1/START domain
MTAAPPTQQPSGTDHMIVSADLPGLTTLSAFDHFTTPERLSLWWPPAAEVEPRIGGHYRLRWPSMNWELFGRYTVYEPGERLGFTWQWLHEPELPIRTVDVVLMPTAEGSHVTVTHGTYSNSATEQQDRQGHIDGWVYFLGQLQSIAQHEAP